MRRRLLSITCRLMNPEPLVQCAGSPQKSSLTSRTAGCAELVVIKLVEMLYRFLKNSLHSRSRAINWPHGSGGLSEG